jgi:hypothetical protein
LEAHPSLHAVTHDPVKGVERPKTESGEGKTPGWFDFSIGIAARASCVAV